MSMRRRVRVKATGKLGMAGRVSRIPGLLVVYIDDEWVEGGGRFDEERAAAMYDVDAAPYSHYLLESEVEEVNVNEDE
jgi:hypothetical protein